MEPGTHFVFGTHKEHGFVASFTPHITPHLAAWFLVREQFDPVPGTPGLFRLSEPERDGPRRTRQAARDLRRQGYAVHTDLALDPVLLPTPPYPVPPKPALDRSSRLAIAAARRTTQASTLHSLAPLPSPATAPRAVSPPAVSRSRPR